MDNIINFQGEFGEGNLREENGVLPVEKEGTNVGIISNDVDKNDGDDLKGRRKRFTHQRSISLISEGPSGIEQSIGDDNGERNLRPRGMSLPHGSEESETSSYPKRRMSFLPGNYSGIFNEGLSSFYNQIQNISVPTISFDSSSGNFTGRKISFGLRKLSQTVSFLFMNSGLTNRQNNNVCNLTHKACATIIYI